MFLNSFCPKTVVPATVKFRTILCNLPKTIALQNTYFSLKAFFKETHKTNEAMIEHLAQGSAEPQLHTDKLTLYGMRFCPYDQRVHLVLIAKQIPHDNVWINLMNKPDWFLRKVPSAKVPGLVVDGQVLYESLIIADFLDEKYSQRPLHSKDPLQKAKDKILIEEFSKVQSAFIKLVKAPGPELIDTLLQELLVFDNHLANRKSTYFGGDKPGMVDYMIWPWFERFRAGKEVFDSTFDMPESKLKHLVPWIGAMMEDSVVKEYLVGPKPHAKFITSFVAGSPKYDIPI